MASIILPRRWQSQPQYPVDIDYANPITNGIKGAGFGINVGNAKLLTLINSAYVDIGKLGIAPRFENATSDYGVIGSNLSPASTNGTVLVVFEPTSLNFTVGLLETASTSNYSGYNVTVSTTGSVELLLGNNVGTGPTDRRSFVTSAGTVATFESAAVAISSTGLTSGRASKNGIPLSLTYSGTAAAYSPGSGSAELGRRLAGSIYGSKKIYAWAVWDRSLSQEELNAITRNPWQIFRPQRRILYFDAGGVGTNTYTYSGDADITFSGTATTTWQKLYSFSGDADITFSGTATTAYVAGAVTYPYNGSGTLTFSGTATTAWLKLYSFNGDADITFSGAATTAYVPAGSTTYSYSGDGSITFSGTATTAWLQLFSYVGSGTLTFSGDATTAYVPGLVEYAYNGSGTIVFSGTADTSGPKIAETVGGGIGHGGFTRKSRRLVKVEEAESPEEVIAEIERAFAETTKKPVKKRTQAKVSPKPVQTPSVDPGAWLDYFREQSRLVREQQMMNDLLAQAKMRVQELQAQETLRRLEALQIQQEEEVLLLLMAA